MGPSLETVNEEFCEVLCIYSNLKPNTFLWTAKHSLVAKKLILSSKRQDLQKDLFNFLLPFLTSLPAGTSGIMGPIRNGAEPALKTRLIGLIAVSIMITLH